MPPVEDLLGLRRAKCGPAGILSGAVTAQDGDAWMRPKLRRERVGRTIGPEVDWPMALQVYQQGAVSIPTTPGPIVHS